MDVAGRVDRLRARLADAGCDALLVTKLVNIRYLTGFTGSAALLLVLPDELLFDHRRALREQAAEELAARGRRRHGPHRAHRGGPVRAVAAATKGIAARRRGARRQLGAASGRWSTRTFRRWANSCPPRAWSRACGS